MVLPTYNERENIEPLLTELRSVAPTATIVVIDDQSPDGTGETADVVAQRLGQIEVLHRSSKDGLGSAYRFGFNWVFVRADEKRSNPMLTRSTTDILVTMDADFSHDPKVVPQLIAAIQSGADAVVGSRYVQGGGTVDWPIHRRLLSRWGNWYTGFILGVGVRDCTSGFRAYRLDALRDIKPETTSADGYAFLTELVVRLHRQGKSIAEVPISFVDRKHGSSKMSRHIVFESMQLVTRWGVKHRWSQFCKLLKRR